MALRFQGEEIRTDRDVTQLLEQIRRDPRTDNPRVLWINQNAQMKAKNGGYPIDMHHETYLPVQVFNEKEEDAMSQVGYRREYKHKDFPCAIYRRNGHPKFHKSTEERQRIACLTIEAQRLEMATDNEGDYIETVTVKNQGELDKFMAQKPNKAAKIGSWHLKVTDIDPLDRDPEEDPAVTIARLQGEVDGMKGKEKGKKSEAA
jgi:hypothetical protein